MHFSSSTISLSFLDVAADLVVTDPFDGRNYESKTDKPNACDIKRFLKCSTVIHAY